MEKEFMIAHETNVLLNSVINTVRNLDNKKSQLGDQSSLFIKNITQKLKSNEIPPVELVFTHYVEELGCDIDFWVKWDGKIFLTSSDGNDDYSPILGQKIQSRFNFVKMIPVILKDMENHFSNELKEMDFFIEGAESEDEEDINSL
jgi:hypothetical protein